MPTPQPQQQARINLSDLKSQIAKRLGPDRAQRYFGFLNQLLSQKLSKPEFNKLCLSTIGRENIPLHNHLIRSILKNAFEAKVPPPQTAVDRASSKPIGALGKSSQEKDNGFNPAPMLAPIPTQPVWSNGHILPPSPRKCRSTIRDRRIKDRPSPLGPNGRTEVTAHHPLPPHDESVFRENGNLALCDLKRPVQHQQGGPAEQPAKRPRIEKPSPHDQAFVHRKGPVKVVAMEEAVEDGDQKDVLISDRGPLRAPLGIPFCPASVGGARRSLPLPTSASSCSFVSNSDNGELCHTEDLKKRMDVIAEAQGLEGVRIDCANLLNNGLDAYLKRLIRSCVQLVGTRLGHEPKEQPVYKQQPHRKPINGVWLGNNVHVQNSSGPSESTPEPKNQHTASLLDFKVAMEQNPQQLGEDWPLLLEKICLSSFEE